MPRFRDSESSDLYSPEQISNSSANNRDHAPGIRWALRHRLDSLFCKTFKDKVTLGTREGAQWTIRVGALDSNSVVYSGGVGGDISFELELVKRFGLSVVIFDPSPIALQTIRQHASDPEMRRIEFNPVGLASESRNLRFESSKVPGEWKIATGERHGSHEIHCTTIPSEMERRGHRKINLLKLDIEGFEYQVLKNCLGNRLDISQICVEFHDFFPNIGRWATLKSILALRKERFLMIHKQRHDFTFIKS